MNRHKQTLHHFPKSCPKNSVFARCLTEEVRNSPALWVQERDGLAVAAGSTGLQISLQLPKREISKGRCPSVPAAPRTLSLVGQQVPVQVVLTAKALLTARAMEGLLPGMGQPVSH